MFASSGFPPLPDNNGIYSVSSAGKLLGFPSCSHNFGGKDRLSVLALEHMNVFALLLCSVLSRTCSWDYACRTQILHNTLVSCMVCRPETNTCHIYIGSVYIHYEST